MLTRKPMAGRLVPNRAVLARRWAHNREGTLIWEESNGLEW